MNSQTNTCQNCRVDFTIEPDDFAFYEKMQVLAPQLCPECRRQRRLIFRNERTFYKRPCDRCHKEVISMYSPNKPFPVWCHECWFSDDWDATEYGRNYDHTRPFFEQVHELWNAVPKVNFTHVRSINCEYINIAADNKDCYMVIESSNNENIIHGYWMQLSKDCIDTSFAHKAELCYECVDIFECNRLFYSRSCEECRDSYFLLDCRNCSDCIGCVNLRNAKYCVFNKKYTKDEYENFIKEAKLDTNEGVEKLRRKSEDFFMTQPRKFGRISNADSCSGNYIRRAKNCVYCFDCYEAENNKYGVHVWRNAKENMDVDTVGREAEFMYNSMNSALGISNCIGCILCWSGAYMQYCFYCFDGQELFGCAGLRKKKYSILNKVYPTSEYEQLKGEIIESMKKSEEYGNFFPASMSPFGYNETPASIEYPLEKDEATSRGYSWNDTPRGTYGLENNVDIFACNDCKKNFRVIPRELEFYKRFSIPLPSSCPDCRNLKRFLSRGPNKLWHRSCMCTKSHLQHSGRCTNEFKTSYSPDRKEIVYCEQCYKAEVV